MQRALLIILLLNINILFSQDGKILSKKRFNILESSKKYELFSSRTDSLRNEYKYLNDIAIYDITYRSDSLTIRGVLIEPLEKGNFPVVIYNRGGNPNFAEISADRMVFSSMSKLASNGYVILASNYRKNDEYGGSDLNDVLNLIKTAKQLPNADTKRLGMFGWSRGGMMTYLALKKSKKIKTAIIGNAPTNLFKVINDRPTVEKEVFEKYIPNYSKNKEQELRKRSVIYWYKKLNKKSSLLIVCGTEDKRANPIHSELVSKKLKSINYNFKLRKFKTGHSFLNKQKELSKLVLNWFNKELKQ